MSLPQTWQARGLPPCPTPSPTCWLGAGWGTAALGWPVDAQARWLGTVRAVGTARGPRRGLMASGSYPSWQPHPTPPHTASISPALLHPQNPTSQVSAGRALAAPHLPPRRLSRTRVFMPRALGRVADRTRTWTWVQPRPRTLWAECWAEGPPREHLLAQILLPPGPGPCLRRTWAWGGHGAHSPSGSAAWAMPLQPARRPEHPTPPQHQSRCPVTAQQEGSRWG